MSFAITPASVHDDEWVKLTSNFHQVPEGKVVVLSFRFIDLENDNLCRYDYVDVYSGHVGGQRLGRFCGTFKPGALVSGGNKMLLQMVSDANTAGSGFLAVFSAAHPHERGRQSGIFCAFPFLLAPISRLSIKQQLRRNDPPEPRGTDATRLDPQVI